VKLTVGDVIASDIVQRGEPIVVAGLTRLGNLVRWVHISEQVDVASYLKGGELLLTTAMTLGDHPELVRQFVRDLRAANVAGVVVRLGPSFPGAPPEMVEEADDVDLPLVVLRRRIGFVEVTEAVHAHIVGEEAVLLRHAEEQRAELTGLVVRGASIGDVIDRLARLLRRTVVLEDGAHQVVGYSAAFGNDGAVLARWDLHSRCAHDDAGAGPANVAGRVYVEDGAPSCAWTTIWAANERWGRLHVLGGEEFDHADLLALDRAGSALGLAVLGDQLARRGRSETRASLLADVIHERLRGPQEFMLRARSQGVDFEGSQLVGLAVRLGGLDALARGEQLTDLERHAVVADMREHVRSALAGEGVTGVTGVDGDDVLAVLKAADGQVLREVAPLLAADIRQRSDRAWSRRVSPVLGVGQPVPTFLVRRTLHQALESATIGESLGSSTEPHHFGDLGLRNLSRPLRQKLRISSVDRCGWSGC